MISSKLENLIKYSIRTFQNKNQESVQVDARKAMEAFCKSVIISHFGEERGANIISSRDIEYNQLLKVNRNQRSKEFDFTANMLVKVVTNYNSTLIDEFYQKKYNNQESVKIIAGYKEYLRRYLDVLVFNGNSSAHESTAINFNRDDIIITQKILSKLLYWLFMEFLDEAIPNELVPYIAKYDIFLSYRHAHKAWVDTLKENLESQGYYIFVDRFMIAGGENLNQRLQQAISNSACSIVIYSDDDSSEWMKKEYEWMKEKRLEDSSFRVIPISIDNSSFNLNKNIRSINFYQQGYKKAFSSLMTAIDGKTPDNINKLKIPLEIKIKNTLLEKPIDLFISIIVHAIIIFIVLALIVKYIYPDLELSDSIKALIVISLILARLYIFILKKIKGA